MYYRYEHMEDFSHIPQPDFAKLSDRLLVYGAGVNGMLCAYALSALGVDFVCFVDANVEKHGTTYCGHPVISPEQMYKDYPDAPIILDIYNYREVQKDLVEKGYSNIISPAFLFIGMDLDAAAKYVTNERNKGAIANNSDGYIFESAVQSGQVREWIDEYFVRGADFYRDGSDFPKAINLDITDRCTLRCKGCLALKPYFNGKFFDPTWEELENTLNNLLSLKYFRRFHILGGEPFLSPYLYNTLEKLINAEEINHINIITNATVLPKKELIPLLQNPKVCIRISYYGDLSSKFSKLVESCKENHIECVVHAQRWLDIGTIKDTLNSKEEAERVFHGCCQRSGSYIYVAHGRCYPCPFAANAHTLKCFESEPDDYADLNEANLAPEVVSERIKKYYFKKTPYVACSYCKGWFPYPYGEPIPVAVQYAPHEQPQLPQY